MMHELNDAIHRRDIERAATYYKLPERVIEDETAKLEIIKRTIADALDGQQEPFSLGVEGARITQQNDDGIPHMRLVMDFSLIGWADEWSEQAVADALIAAAAEILKRGKV